MYFVYVLKSEKDGKNYIGSTSDIEKRLQSHNDGKNISTKHRIPFDVIFKKEFKQKKDALIFESLLKRQKGGDGLKKLIMLG